MRNHSFLISLTQVHNLNAQLKKLTHEAWVKQSLLVEALLILLNMKETLADHTFLFLDVGEVRACRPKFIFHFGYT
ncbi:hypothetical protein DEO72_LG10g2831 [Vigna unguiculata]|uniref:Uncharacterized protein n=1 Tax=Vigna unguiculata TaxID=3917 RepID=A0A4D6NE27_VIGUN|nr:hypothetical protein DEO72_LG10g2831 [Vigna unguiculata]